MLRTVPVHPLLTAIVIVISTAHGYTHSRFSTTIRKPVASSPTLLALAYREDGHSEIHPAEAIKRAIEATKRYGVTSLEARTTWEVVENMEYPHQNISIRAKVKKAEVPDVPDNVPDDVEMFDKRVGIDVMEEATYDAIENNVRDLKELLDEEMAKVSSLKFRINAYAKEVKKPRTINEVKSIEAISAAQEASREYGIHSEQTALAWKAFEETVSGDLSP